MTTFSSLSPTQRAELWACLALRHSKGIGALRGKRLVEAYGSAFAAVEAGRLSASAWAELELVPASAGKQFTAESWRDKAKAEWETLQRMQCGFVFLTDDQYPALLREIPDAPLILYYKGNVSLLRSPSVGIVGSRRCTREGVAVAAFFGRGLSQAGVTIISGMAQGIDRAAHLAGLESVGSSIAVLGTGIDMVYPPCNNDLAGLLARKGLILTEFAPCTPAHPKHFPVRNRLISGLSRGVLVVEAAGRSGSLITARLALEQGREVFAVPGHTTADMSEGCRELIRRGAKPVFTADDVLVELAPLLTQDARRALEERGRTQNKRDAGGPGAFHKDAYDAALASAVSVLPQGEIPWLAPDRQPDAPCSASAHNENVPHRHQASPEKPILAPSARAGAGESLEGLRLSTDEHAVVGALSAKPVHIDALATGIGLDVAKVSSLLTMLEIRGVVRRMPGMLYMRG